MGSWGSGEGVRGVSRRAFLRRGAGMVGGLGAGVFGGVRVARAAGADGFGPLQAADANGLELPAGFTSRVVATTGQVVPGTGHVWHASPDGGAVFQDGSGWIYVSNAELSSGLGGVSALAFDGAGNVVGAYGILSGTSRNCAGGPTPWGTWISCEEHGSGQAWECDPTQPSQGVVLPALGTFQHEAAALDPVHEEVYLTEDRSDGLLYRVTPAAYPDLSSGTMEALEILDPNGDGPIVLGDVRPLAWHPITEPNPPNGGSSSPQKPVHERATRYQADSATPFDGGEGCWYEGGRVYFTTKGDDQVWMIDTAADTIEMIYEHSGSLALSAVDNVMVAPNGDVYVAEDGGNLEIVALTPTGGVVPVMRLTGVTGTEITGPALTPDGTRLYFSEQRNPGTTYEVSGPFFSLPEPPKVPSVSPLGAVLLAGGVAALGALAARRAALEGSRGEGRADQPAPGTTSK